tara:strand:- start:73 stop:681 length:609 start_codon:yes stop_codon:yes gene_type:complete
MKFLKKIIGYGIRKALVRGFIFIICKLKGMTYRYILSDNKPCIVASKITQPTQFLGKGVIEVYKAKLGAWPSAGLLDRSGYIEARCPGAIVKIGESTALNNSFVIIADKTSVAIGRRCLIGPNFFASDSDFHGLAIDDRRGGKYECRPVHIEDDVFISEGVRVMKGVRIGQGSVIGVGSIVVSDVEPMSVYGGVPARKLRSL